MVKVRCEIVVLAAGLDKESVQILPLTISTSTLTTCAVYGVAAVPMGLMAYTFVFYLFSLVLIPYRAKRG